VHGAAGPQRWTVKYVGRAGSRCPSRPYHAPDGRLLAQEASSVTYRRDTDTLFSSAGDVGRPGSKTGALNQLG